MLTKYQYIILWVSTEYNTTHITVEESNERHWCISTVFPLKSLPLHSQAQELKTNH